MQSQKKYVHIRGRSASTVLAIVMLGLLIGGERAAESQGTGLITVPHDLAATDPHGFSPFPFQVVSPGDMRYQQVYRSSEFGISPVVITAMAFRPDADSGSAFSSNLGRVQINLSTTSAAPDGLSPTFANNVGPNNTVVYDAALTLSSSDTGGPPTDFDIIINLQNGFLYDPSQGNLLMDVRVFSGVTSGTTTQFDAPFVAGDSVSVVFAHSPNDASGTTNTFGLVTRFSAVPANEPPVADAGPDQTVPCGSAAGASVTLNGNGSYDPEGEMLSFHWDVPAGITLNDPDSPTPAGVFPIGVTMATLTVADPRGGVGVDDVVITVVDRTPPEVRCTTDLAALWPPNHRMVPIVVSVEATDACTAPQNLALLSVTVSCDEADDAPGLGDSETTGDTNGVDGFASSVDVTGSFSYNAAARRFEGVVSLRAERDDMGDGRAYTIRAWVVDTQYNVGMAGCVVVVPHDQRRK